MSYKENKEEFSISLLVGLKNNLEYSKVFYQTTRDLYPNVELVFVSYGSTDATHDWLDAIEDTNVKYYYSDTSKSLSDTYNKCISLATKEFVAFLHNDIILTPNFIENLEKNVSEKLAITYTTIEPPIFTKNDRPGKLIKNFGDGIEDVNIKGLFEFSIAQQEVDKDKLVDGAFFFMCLSRSVLLKIGGFDNLFSPMFCEDDDLIYRLRLYGLELKTSLDAICYHFVSKTSRFSEEYINKTKKIERNSNRNFFRKWTFNFSSRSKLKYDIAFCVKNCTPEIIKEIEPYCTVIYVDCDYESYILSEKEFTKIDLYQRIKPLSQYNGHDVCVTFDANSVDAKRIGILQNLSDILTKKQTKEKNAFYQLLPLHKNFTLKSIKIKVNIFETYEKKMITKPIGLE